MKKKVYLVLDTETANSVNYPLPYDVGYKLVESDGTYILHRSFCVYEIFVQQKEMMQSAYYAEKIPSYQKELKEGLRKLARLYTVRKTILEDMEKYNITEVYAYNMNFDKRALNNDLSFTTENRYRYFFPYGTEFKCIWNMACDCLMSRPSFIKFAEKNNFISEKGNLLTNAEVCYKYITKNIDFKEQHTGLEDVLIETAIMAYCYKQHKKFDTVPYSVCWRKVQRKRKEIELNKIFSTLE